MKLQLALDGGLSRSLDILNEVRPYIDIAEIGTPLVFREGVTAIRRVKSLHPDLTLLADFKIMDAGEEEASIAFDAGADIVTVLGVTQDVTVQGALKAAAKAGKQIMVDLMAVQNIPDRVRTLLAMGCHFMCVHTAHDLHTTQDASPFAHLQELRRRLPGAPLAVAGGIKPDNLAAVLSLNPVVVVVGGAITNAPDPAAVSRDLHERMEAHAHL